MAIHGVLLDFSGTLFRLEPGAESVRGLRHRDGAELTAARYTEILATLTVPTGVPEHLPPDLHDAWHRRDLDGDLHRASYESALTAPHFDLADGTATGLYDVMLAPASWVPYPDTDAALRLLRARGIPVAVVSNIAWDLRATFAHRGLDGLVDEYVLSYAEGVVKPDAKIFTVACERIGRAPADTLMVGDSAAADGAAAAIGCRFERVEPQATANRPDALLGALRAHGIAD
ncbi:HAD-IA family hydrolase [Actinokineospora auranticolor]|uniref:HAD superfamily hydrolase (TIGR01493 family)/HAD superfamily hydrolase (TIGR01509 family)/HAD superfamily hydrolase (TIGR01549 family) n=1 Tax=Actinokineospora auranticolor TaxID=155976 RepID=A0A2S6GZQ2_9PSEU|nr:HAD-IA family hydrolase [Actinokineospora auranticolor]PPK70641.1 HAD superfamily hydrolase (TIGR01493 family)/HAD superfamily hydrolase (TIGR01509 family)/HAD superfamily hydrolase (TIGR01549 family) [Actinokineospora auranticolor]